MIRLGRLVVAWGRRDGLHLACEAWHFHAFVWTRGRRRWPLYVRFLRG